MILSDLINNPGIILLIILGIAAVIGIVAYVIYRFTHPKLKEKEEIDEEKNLQEELDRVLQPVEDEKTAEEIKNYKSPEDEE